MANRIRLSRIAIWGAWVVAGGVGYMLPYLGASLGWFGPTYPDGWTAIIASAAIVAFPQYIVLRVFIGHSSLAGAMWIPVSVVASVAADQAIFAFGDRIANALFSVGAIQALLRGPIFSLILVIDGIQGITLAAVVGLAQGLLLTRVFAARSAAWIWFVGNLIAAVVVLIVTQLINGLFNQTNETTVELLLLVAILGGLYAAVTGIVLVGFSRRDPKGAAPIAD
jgi:hypothetical protein